jgi:hypothetical protein
VGRRKLVATYDQKGIHYDIADPLGTKRIQANTAGQVDESCMSLPFGNDINNPVSANCVQAANSLGTSDDATEHHFTQKERETHLSKRSRPAKGALPKPS